MCKTMGKSLNEQVEDLEALIVPLLEESGIPGASLAIVMGDKMIFSKGFGARDLERNLPASSETLFGIASCSKSFTAMAIMQLVESGKIDLQDPVNKYIPLKLGSENKPITIHHLLTMSSGLPDTGLTRVLLSRYCKNDKSVFQASSLEQIMLHINRSTAWMVEPEKRFFYSNESYALLSMIVQKVTNTPFPEYMRENIFKPLNMKRTTYNKEDFEKEEDKMVPYMENTIITNHPFDLFINGCGGILSSVNDLANFLIAMMNEGVYKENSVLEKESIEKILTLHFECNMASSYLGNVGEGEGYGYGWIVMENFLGNKWIGHLGQIDGSSAGIIFVPKRKMGVVIACNTGMGQGLMAAIPIIVIASLLGLNPMELPFIATEQKMNILTGIYKSYKGINEVSISKKGSLLYIKAKNILGDDAVPLIPEKIDSGDCKFYIISGPGARESVEFTVTSNQEVDLFYERYHFRKARDI